MVSGGNIINHSYQQSLNNFGAVVKQLPEPVKNEITPAFTSFLSAARNGMTGVLEMSKGQIEQVLVSHNASESVLAALNEWAENGMALAQRNATKSYATVPSSPKIEENKQEVVSAHKKGIIEKLFSKLGIAQPTTPQFA